MYSLQRPCSWQPADEQSIPMASVLSLLIENCLAIHPWWYHSGILKREGFSTSVLHCSSSWEFLCDLALRQLQTFVLIKGWLISVLCYFQREAARPQSSGTSTVHRRHQGPALPQHVSSIHQALFPTYPYMTPFLKRMNWVYTITARQEVSKKHC